MRGAKQQGFDLLALRARRVRVDAWAGPTPQIGDRLRSRRGRYLITRVELNSAGKPSHFTLVNVDQARDAGLIIEGKEHPWVWSRRGRSRAR